MILSAHSASLSKAAVVCNSEIPSYLYGIRSNPGAQGPISRPLLSHLKTLVFNAAHVHHSTSNLRLTIQSASEVSSLTL